MSNPTIWRGTTPPHVFTLPVEEAAIAALWISYAQSGCVVLTKELADCAFSGREATVQLSQAETLAFDQSGVIAIQVRLRDDGGNAYASEIVYAEPGHILKEGEI